MRKGRESQLTGRLRLCHLLEHTEAVDEEMEQERGRFDRLRKGGAPRVVSAFNLFQTPEPIAAQAVDLAGIEDHHRVAEPSAGLGRIYRAVRDVSACPITLVEIAPGCCRELYAAIEGDEDAKLVQGDFLEHSGTYDRIVMNPPFKMWRDIKHVKHALTLLAPGGRCVSLVANGPKQNAKLKPLASEWIELPAKSFKTEGTNVNVAIAVFEARR